MGVTVNSKDYSCRLGYGGFKNFRDDVAKLLGEEMEEHYIKSFAEAMFLHGEKRTEFFKKYDAKTNDLIKDRKLDLDVAIFLYESDCDGKLTKKQAKKIYEIIKNCDDYLSYGYPGKPDCTTMKDFKNIFGNGSTVKWY